MPDQVQDGMSAPEIVLVSPSICAVEWGEVAFAAIPQFHPCCPQNSQASSGTSLSIVFPVTAHSAEAAAACQQLNATECDLCLSVGNPTAGRPLFKGAYLSNPLI